MERKESAANSDRLSEAICAFANDMPGYGEPGVLFVGVSDRGGVLGRPVTDELLRHLADLRDQGTVLPPPMMTVRKLCVDGGEVAVVEVRPSATPPVRFQGRVYIRVGLRRAIASCRSILALSLGVPWPTWTPTHSPLCCCPPCCRLTSWRRTSGVSGSGWQPSPRHVCFLDCAGSVAQRHRAEVVLVDVGPGLGAINRAALVASDHVVVPVVPDLFSLQGLRDLGPTLRGWRGGWQRMLDALGETRRPLPAGGMAPLGYIVLGQGVRLSRPVQAYQRWISRIPGDFHDAVLGRPGPPPVPDSYCLAQLTHYHSLMPLAQEARKPMFALKPADGAFGGHSQADARVIVSAAG